MMALNYRYLYITIQFHTEKKVGNTYNYYLMQQEFCCSELNDVAVARLRQCYKDEHIKNRF